MKTLYGPLFFYLSYLDSLNKHKQKIFEAADKRLKDLTEILDSTAKKHWVDEHFLDEKKLLSIVVKKWWLVAEKILQLLENNPEQIKADDLPAVQEFINGYIGREYLGKEVINNEAWSFLGEKADKEVQVIIDALEKLKIRILKKK
ncbi:MAG: hypothetical protein M1334_04775 [Patescibacteria group bacterium]|nr:hypothetical protein [Patescibacteria group bacterium]